MSISLTKGKDMHIVIFRMHGQLQLETMHIGPFTTHEEAYDYLCELPALGICPEGQESGCKYIAELFQPEYINPKSP